MLKKPLTLWLPDADYDVLREDAAARRLPVQKRALELLMEKIHELKEPKDAP